MKRRRIKDKQSDDYKKGYQAGYRRIERGSKKIEFGKHSKDWIRGLHAGRKAAKRGRRKK